MSVVLLLGAATALSFGVGDLLQGVASRRLPVLAVLVVGQSAGLLAVLGAAVMTTQPAASTSTAWGAAAGVAAVAGTALLLLGFRRGRISVVAPTASVAAAGIPVVVDLLRDISLSPSAAAGIALAITATVLVTRAEPNPPAASRSGGAALGLGAVTAHDAMYLALGQAGTTSGLWPVVANSALFVDAACTTLVTTAGEWRRVGCVRMAT